MEKSYPYSEIYLNTEEVKFVASLIRHYAACDYGDATENTQRLMIKVLMEITAGLTAKVEEMAETIEDSIKEEKTNGNDK